MPNNNLRNLYAVCSLLFPGREYVFFHVYFRYHAVAISGLALLCFSCFAVSKRFYHILSCRWPSPLFCQSVSCKIMSSTWRDYCWYALSFILSECQLIKSSTWRHCCRYALSFILSECQLQDKVINLETLLMVCPLLYSVRVSVDKVINLETLLQVCPLLYFDFGKDTRHSYAKTELQRIDTPIVRRQ
jgi:hypothetical protein